MTRLRARLVLWWGDICSKHGTRHCPDYEGGHYCPTCYVESEDRKRAREKRAAAVLGVKIHTA